MSDQEKIATELASINTHILYIRENIDEQKVTTKDHGEDIESLQKSRAWLQGAWAVLSLIVVWIGTHLPKGLL